MPPTHVVKAMTRSVLSTPGMKRPAIAIGELPERLQCAHALAQRARCPRTLADDILSLHTRNSQLVPGSNLRIALPPAPIASVYHDDALGFAVPAWTAKFDLPRMTRSEADALFENCDPVGEDFTPRKIDVTVGFLTECLHMCPNVPMAIREVMNSSVVDGYQLPVGTRLYIAQTAQHDMEDVFPDPFTCDIGRYLPPRSEQRGPGYSP